MCPKVGPAIYFEVWKAHPAEDGGDIGAVLHAMVDDLDEEEASLVIKRVAVLLLVNDLVG